MQRPAPFLCALVTVLAAAAPAKAQTGLPEQDADFGAFCREAFPGSAYVKRTQSWGAGHYCSQAGVLQGIDLDRACELTTGSAGYRQLGDRIICAAGPGPRQAAGQPLNPDDFVSYCRDSFANGSYQFVAEQPDNPHYCRQPGATGGFSLQPVDLAQACGRMTGAPFYSELNGTVFCVASEPPQTADRQGAAAANATRPPVPPAPVEPSLVPTDTRPESSEPALKNTGSVSPSESWWTVDFGSLKGATLRLRDQNGALTGTLEKVPASLEAYVRQWTVLEIGDVVFSGTRAGTSVRGKTILGIASPRRQPPGREGCAGLRTSLLNDPSQWPELEATLEDGLFDGRYRGINVWFKDGGCGKYPFVDYPPLVRDGWVQFDLVQGTN